MSKIHELLAAEKDRTDTANAMLEEGRSTFTKRHEHFNGSLKILTMFDEKREAEGTTDETLLQTTVDQKLDHIWPILSRAMDATLTKENTNCSSNATADVMINDTVLIEAVPVGALMALHKYLGKVRALYATLPTLAPAIAWEGAASLGQGVFKSASPNETIKTEKTLQHKILDKATDKHPAQIEKWTQDVPVGKYSTTHFSGAITVAQKAQYMERIDKLTTAVKQAIQRANMAEVEPLNVAKTVRDYLEM